MRILKFIGVFLGTLIIVLFIVFGFNLDALYTLYENREGLQEGREWVDKTSSLKGLTEYIGAQPDHVSVASLAVNNPDSSILYNEHAPRTMGRLSNIFLITEYARRVERGALDPEMRVPIDEINSYQLPYMDASNHEDALSVLDEEGKINDDDTVALTDVVRMAVEYNDLAASDYLLFLLGPDNIIRLMDDLSISETESILPFSGLYITLNPHLHGLEYEQHMDSLRLLSRVEFEERVWESARKFTGEPDFREKVLNQFEEHNGLGVSFIHERDMIDFFPKTTAMEMATLMQLIQQDRLISRRVSQQLKGIMNWPLSNERLSSNFKTYGAMYDSRMGMANGISFGSSAYSQEPFAQAVLFDDLPVAFWFHMSSNLIHQDFEQRLIWDPALRAATLKQITRDRKSAGELNETDDS